MTPSQLSTNEGLAEFEHNGIRIYPTPIRDAAGEVTTRWAVESSENRMRRAAGERALGGDSLAPTAEQARVLADQQARRDAANAQAAAEREAEQARAEAAKADRSARTAGMSLADIRAMDYLDQLVRTSSGVTTRRAWVEQLVRDGAEPSIDMVDKVKPMSSRQYFRATNAEQQAHEKRVREGGKVAEYYLGDYKVSKTEHDYAIGVLARKAEATPSSRSLEDAAMTGIEGVFIKQVWGGPRGDDAVTVEEVPFDATLTVLALPLESIHALEDTYDNSDNIGREHVDHDGPCEVAVADAVCEFFGVDTLDEITQSMLEDKRHAYGVDAAEPEGMKP